MRATRNRKKEADRAECAADVEQFLAAGGRVHQVQRHENKWYRDRETTASRGPQNMQVVTGGRGDAMRRAWSNPGATPDHIWRNKTDATTKSLAEA